MPSKYDRAGALPLRVPPELRAEVDALAASLPRGLPLARNAVAVAALRAGLDALRAQLGADPFAVHRVYAAAVEGGDQVQGVLPLPSTPAPIARGNGGARAPRTAPDASRGGDEGAPDPAAARSRPRAAAPKASAPTRRPRPPATGDAPLPSTGAPEGPDAPPPDAVRELLATVLDRDRAVKPGSRGWTVKALAAALGCNRKALQVFRADGSGMGRALQLRLWSTLRSDPPPKG